MARAGFYSHPVEAEVIGMQIIDDLVELTCRMLDFRVRHRSALKRMRIYTLQHMPLNKQMLLLRAEEDSIANEFTNLIDRALELPETRDLALALMAAQWHGEQAGLADDRELIASG